MKLNNNSSSIDLSIIINVSILKVEPWIVVISSRPGFDSKVRSDSAPSQRSNDKSARYSNTPFNFEKSILY